MKLPKNEKGMTLVEIIVATAIFGMTCATLFTSILYAVEQNKNSYYAGKEIQLQMNSAEKYNSKKSIFDNKVIKYKFSSTRSNKVSYAIDFSTTTDGIDSGHSFDMTNDDVYAYMAIKGVEDRAAEYQMRFFEAENKNAVDPDAKKYWINLYNYSSSDRQIAITINESAGVGLYEFNGDPIAHEKEGIVMADDNGTGRMMTGLNLKNYDDSNEEILLIGDWFNDYFDGSGYVPMTGRDLLLTKDNFDDYCEYVDGKPTGYINIYYDGEDYYNADQMDAKHPGSVG